FAPRALPRFTATTKQSAPSPVHRYFRPRGLSRLCLFPWHRRLGSHVPYESLVELRAAYMPDRSGSIRASPELIPEEGSPPGFDIAYPAFAPSSTVRLPSPPSPSPAGISSRR